MCGVNVTRLTPLRPSRDAAQRTTLGKLWAEGGIRRLYQGYSIAVIEVRPLSAAPR